MLRPALVLTLVSACQFSYILDEDEGVAVAREVFTRHGIDAMSTRELGPLTLDDVVFTADGWSAAARLGFEYVSEADPDFTEATTDLGAIDQYERLQTAVDDFLATEGGHVLILRTWTHETAELAREQLDKRVDAWLIAQGY